MSRALLAATVAAMLHVSISAGDAGEDDHLDPASSSGLRGTLVELSTGRPIRAFAIQLDPYGAGATTVARTDAEGRFAFPGVPAGQSSLNYKSGDYWPGMQGADGHYLRLDVPEAGSVDLGRVVVQSDAEVTRAFGSVCDTRRAETPPSADLLVFTKTSGKAGAWQHSYDRRARIASRWTPPWKAAVCIEESHRVVGTYGSGYMAARGYQTTWKVQLVRLSDGKKFGTKVSQRPPSVSRSRYAEFGDPIGELSSWLNSGKIPR
jgi:hypothetical protein